MFIKVEHLSALQVKHVLLISLKKMSCLETNTLAYYFKLHVTKKKDKINKL
jgi:hypothetical protein